MRIQGNDEHRAHFEAQMSVMLFLACRKLGLDLKVCTRTHAGAKGKKLSPHQHTHAEKAVGEQRSNVLLWK